MAAPSGTGRGRSRGPELRATCRLQLHGGVDLAGARALVPYLRSLGISHLYLSPIFRSRSASDHGYDGVDLATIDPRLGTESDLVALGDALHDADMGLILDFVPNHMAADAENPAWMDVLARGRDSRFAAWFDVDWDAAGGRVVLPFLGERLPAAIAAGELRLVHESNGYTIRYHDDRFPLGESVRAELEAREPEDVIATYRDPARLRELLDRQPWRLAYWKRAPNEINYRRFFTVSHLVTLRQEDPRVFDETHATVLSWVNRGLIDGLRIDHVDGLLDPTAYLRRLRERAPDILIHVEKILAYGEALPADWPVDGTTGYDFLAEAEDLFIHPQGLDALQRIWRRHTRQELGGREVSIRAKRRILERHLISDVRRVTMLLERAARAEGVEVGSTEALARAVVETIAALPVYRTYIQPGRREASPAERESIDEALDLAGLAGTVPTSVRLLRSLLLDPASWTGGVAAARAAFVERFQQLCVPAAAKGVEDTAFYAWVPLASRNEVGADPAVPPDNPVAAFHEAAATRAQRYPRALLAVSTHDTKRSADVRARLDALSEMPEAWAGALRRWRRWNQEARTRVSGRLVPDAATKLLYYQTLVGAWPLDDLAPGDRPPPPELVDRIDAYLCKAAREAKLGTSWTRPDRAFEDALHAFVRRTLQPEQGRSVFLASVRAFAATLAAPGLWTSLARTLLHCTAPGVPDIYRGDELWTFDLVDPDNRRSVDFELRARLLDTMPEHATALLASPHDGRLKMFVIRQALALRREWPDVFAGDGYEPLPARGSLAGHVVAFARRAANRTVVAAAARLIHDISGEIAPVGSVWTDTVVLVPDDPAKVRCVLTGEMLEVQRRDGQAWVRASDLFARLPVTLLRVEAR